MNLVRLSLFFTVLVLASCNDGCSPPIEPEPSSDFKPPTAPPHPPTGGLPDELRPPR